MTLSPQQTQAIKRHLQAGLRAMYRPDPLPLAEWADRNFYLSAESSYTVGPWKSHPYQVPILNMMGNDDIRELNWRKSARVGYTKCITAAIAYFTEHKQRNQILWQPKEAAAEGFMQQHVQPTIRDVPLLRKLAPWYGKKHSDNKLDYKRFSNSRQLFVMGGAAASNYREKSVDVVYYDELSKFDGDIEGEGPPTLLGDKRLEGSAFPKSIRGSTPTLVGECQLSKAADEAEEQFQRFVPCPHCDEHQVLEWGGPDCDYGIKWDSPETVRQAYYVCKHCGAVIEQRDLAAMDAGGEYRSQTGMVTRDGLTFYRDGQQVDPPATVSVHVWAAYSPGTSWGQIAFDFLRVKGDPVKLKGWVNTTLGEPWEEAGERVEAHSLYMRREHYPEEIPQAAVVVVGGVDTQPDRLECSAWAFGPGNESWLVEHQIFYGDPNLPEVWERLTQWRHGSYQHESGARLRMAACGIDTGGHNTDAVYKYCKQHAAQRVYALKGSSTPGAPLAGRPSKNNKGKVDLFLIGTDTAKEMILGRLQIAEPGAGYVHFPVERGTDREYFEQLTGEKRVPVKRAGRIVHAFKAVRKRVEALDCYVYALAALEILNPDFEALARRLVPADDEPEPEPDTAAEPEQAARQYQQQRRARSKGRRRGKGFANSWRN